MKVYREITKKQYDALLPIYGLAGTHNHCLIERKNISGESVYYFMGSKEEFRDAMNRCKYLD